MPDPGSKVRYQSSHYAMGTMFSITAYGSGSDYLETAVRKAFDEIDRLETMLSHYRPDSELSILNRDAFGKSVAVSTELFALVQRCLHLSSETGGAFDITVGKLMKSWGFFQGNGRLVSQAELLRLLERTGFRHVRSHLEKQSIGFDASGVELDMGAIGKGYAVDRAVRILGESGIAHALVSGGTSSIYALGAPPGQDAWRITICHPLDRRRPACVLRLIDQSVSVSGIFEKSFAIEGKLYSHILNPASGEPRNQILMSVVLASSSTESDALSTSFLVGGPDLARAYLSCHPGTAAVLYVQDDPPERFEEVVLHSSVNPLPEGWFVSS